jgi:hypothetical protein
MPPRDYFFVVGCPRSGTTLLSVMLDRHTHLSVPPETAFFTEVAPRLWYRRRAGVLRLLRRWPRLAELQLDPEAVVGRMATPWGKKPVAAELLAAILDLYAERTGKPRCGEKTPYHLPHVPTILRFFPDARVICMLRHGRENALSLRSMPWFRGDLRTAAKAWIENARLMETFARRYPERFQIVRYEELASDPAGTVTKVMDFLGERFESQQISSAVRSDVVLPRSMSWKGQALEAVDTSAIDRRSRNANAEELAFLESSLRDDLVRLGYAKA